MKTKMNNHWTARLILPSVEKKPHWYKAICYPQN